MDFTWAAVRVHADDGGGMHRVGQLIVLRYEERIQRRDRCQPSVDGNRFEALFRLRQDEEGDVLKGDYAWWPVSNRLRKILACGEPLLGPKYFP